MVIALIALFVALTGSAAAVTVAYAKNSDKVDGKHAVASSASIFKPAGKLVATSGASGRLPSNIIPATNYTIVTGPTTTMCASGGLPSRGRDGWLQPWQRAGLGCDHGQQLGTRRDVPCGRRLRPRNEQWKRRTDERQS